MSEKGEGNQTLRAIVAPTNPACREPVATTSVWQPAAQMLKVSQATPVLVVQSRTV